MNNIQDMLKVSHICWDQEKQGKEYSASEIYWVEVPSPRSFMLKIKHKCTVFLPDLLICKVLISFVMQLISDITAEKDHAQLRN